MAETNLAETVVEYLSTKNVRHIFGILAHTSFVLGDAIAKRPHMRFVNAQHEGGAGNMALGYARATKKPAVCLVSAGGGATNIVTAVAQAYKESVPLFVISSDIGTASSSKGAWSSWHGMEHDMLLKASAPVVLVGTGVDWSGAQKEVQELAELLSLPVAASYTAKGVFSENHPLALGCLGGGGRPYARKFFLESDLILALGTTFSEGTTLGFGHRTIPDKAKIIQIDIDPDELGRNYPTQLSVQADVKVALRAIIDGIKSKRPSTPTDGRRAQEVQEAKKSWQNDLHKKVANGGVNYDSVLRTLNELLTGRETLVTAGMTGDTLRNIDAAMPIIHAGEFRAIGTALATSLGVKLGLPNTRVVCVTGDGSFMMEQQELATARLHNIPVLVVVLRNNAYGGMRRDQLEHYGGRVIGTELFVPDLARLAELFGATGVTVTRHEELRPVFQQSLESDNLVVVDVKLDQ